MAWFASILLGILGVVLLVVARQAAMDYERMRGPTAAWAWFAAMAAFAGATWLAMQG